MSEESKPWFPKCGADYIDLVVRKVGGRQRMRAEVCRELFDHFVDALRDCAIPDERERAAEKLIAEFGEPKMLAKLMRRGKKRCRPLWLKALIRTCQVLGIIILLIVIRVATLAFGTPGHTIDHYAKLNELGRRGLDDSQNAALVLDKAALVMVKAPKWLEKKRFHLPLKMNEAELAELNGWLASNTEALDLVRTASEMSSSWVTYHPMSSDANYPAWVGEKWYGTIFFSSVMWQTQAEISSLLELKNMLIWHCLYEAQEGHVAAAMDDAIAMVRLGTFYENKGLLIDSMFGIVMEGMGTTSLCEVLAAMKSDPALLAKTQARLQQLYHEHPTIGNLSGEKILWDECIQSSYTDSGRMLGHGIPFLCHGWTSSVKGFMFGVPGKVEAQKMVDGYYALLEETMRKTPWQRRSSASVYEKNLKESGTLSLQAEGPNIVKSWDKAWQVIAQRGATLAVLAIERYRLEKGRLPESLDELVKSDYLMELPMDPWSDKPLVYKLTPEGFILYSIGFDFEDNGGKELAFNGKPARWSGDIVFWPIH
jgi:hypothetical protein